MRTFSIIIFAFLCIGCKNKDQSGKEVTQEEYNVYAALLSGLITTHDNTLISLDSTYEYIVFHKTVRGLVVDEQADSNYKLKTSPKGKPISLNRFVTPEELNSLVPNAGAVFSDTLSLDHDRFNLPIKIRMFSEQTFDEVKAKKYSKGFIYLSRVAFNTRRDEALVYYLHTGEGSEAITFLLKKANNKWQIVDGVCHLQGWSNSYCYYSELLIHTTPPVPIPRERQ